MLPRAYKRLLAIRPVRVPLAGVVVGRLPIAAMSLATVLLLRHETGSFAVAGAVEACIAIATAASLPLQGRLIDRYGQTRILLPVAALNPLAMTALVVAAKGGASPAALGAIGMVCGGTVPALGAAMRTLWGQLVPDTALRQSAFALDAVLVETAFITGPLLTAVLVSADSPALAVLVNAGLTLAGTLTFALSGRRGGGGERRMTAAGPAPWRQAGLAPGRGPAAPGRCDRRDGGGDRRLRDAGGRAGYRRRADRGAGRGEPGGRPLVRRPHAPHDRRRALPQAADLHRARVRAAAVDELDRHRLSR